MTDYFEQKVLGASLARIVRPWWGCPTEATYVFGDLMLSWDYDGLGNNRSIRLAEDLIEVVIFETPAFERHIKWGESQKIFTGMRYSYETFDPEKLIALCKNNCVVSFKENDYAIS